jgi:ribosomal protein S27E
VLTSSSLPLVVRGEGEGSGLCRSVCIYIYITYIYLYLFRGVRCVSRTCADVLVAAAGGEGRGGRLGLVQVGVHIHIHNLYIFIFRGVRCVSRTCADVLVAAAGGEGRGGRLGLVQVGVQPTQRGREAHHGQHTKRRQALRVQEKGASEGCRRD